MKLTLLVFSIFLTSFLYAQCPIGATVTANDKCVFLTWDQIPPTLPSFLTVGGVQYNLVSGSGGAGDPAIYRDSTPGGGACNANQGNNFDGELVIEGTDTCTFDMGVLGVEWIDISVIMDDGKTILKWDCISGDDHLLFYIERSVDGLKWNSIGTNRSESPGQIMRYEFIDRNAMKSNIYYRVVEESLDGTLSFSPIVSLTNEEGVDVIQQFGKTIYFRINESSSTGDERAYLTDVNGRMLMNWSIRPNDSIDMTTIDIQKGIYVLIFETKDRRVSRLIQL